MTLWKLTIEYDGGAYAGWQRQEDGIPTVQQAVEDAFYGFCQQRVTLHAAGRTDAGVHARGQVAHIDLDYGDRPLSGHDLGRALNAHLRDRGISIVSAEEAPPGFHARFSAVSKLYTYRILNRPAPPALGAGRIWHIWKPLDVAAMTAAAKHLEGHHDFTTFRDSHCQAKSPVRTLDRLEIEEHNGDEIHIHAQARSFLHHQVRNITGTLALVGEGKWTPADVKTALESRDRTKGGPTAPPEGLYLVRVDY